MTAPGMPLAGRFAARTGVVDAEYAALQRRAGDSVAMNLVCCCQDCNVGKARFIATRIISAVNDYLFIWEGRVHRVGASAGITLIDDNNHQAAEVMSQADIACYALQKWWTGPGDDLRTAASYRT